MKLELPLNITSRAFSEIEKIKNTKGIPQEYGLRIIADATGCSDVGFRIGFDKKKEDDEEYAKDGISIFIKKKEFMFLVGVTLDFIESGETQGFTFS